VRGRSITGACSAITKLGAAHRRGSPNVAMLLCYATRMARRPDLFVFLAIVCAANLAPTFASYAAVREPVRACTLTRVAYVGYRAGDSGSVIEYANGLWQVDYNIIPGMQGSRRGDRVLLCLTDIPVGCPPGDDRGRTYKGTNLRTLESWSAINSEHSCGGA
jgi:hypothetical protein